MQRALPPQGHERRRSWRFPCECPVLMSRLLSQRRVAGQMLDLSASGCLVRADEGGILETDDVIELSFSIHGYSIRVFGCIRNVRSYNSLGIEFRDRNEDTVRQIGRLVQKLAEDCLEQNPPLLVR